MKEKNNKTNKQTKAKQKQNKTKNKSTPTRTPGTTTLHLATKHDDKEEPFVYPTLSKKFPKKLSVFEKHI